MRLGIELDREADGRWIAEVVDLPGVLVYGTTRDEALAGAQALALRVVADQLEHGEAPAVPLDLSFVVNAA
jgi:predicted RNase H-like HicB family nuclease